MAGMLAVAFAFGARAQKPADATVASSLTWIGGHFETSTEITRVLDDAGIQDHYTTTTQTNSMTFQGCTVTLVISQKLLHVAKDGTTDNNYSGTLSAKFDLSNLVRGKIHVTSRDQESCYPLDLIKDADKPAPDCPDLKGVTAAPQLVTLLLPAVAPIATTDSVWGSSTYTSLQIRFATLDLANRQADAWRAAVLACGGK
jgi:hypothetical protein